MFSVRRVLAGWRRRRAVRTPFRGGEAIHTTAFPYVYALGRMTRRVAPLVLSTPLTAWAVTS